MTHEGNHARVTARAVKVTFHAGASRSSRSISRSIKKRPRQFRIVSIEFRHTTCIRVVRVMRLYKRAYVRTADHETKPTRQAVNPWQRRHYIRITYRASIRVRGRCSRPCDPRFHPRSLSMIRGLLTTGPTTAPAIHCISRRSNH